MTTQEDLKIPFGKTEIPASLALPESGTAPWPGVVVIHEMLGLNDDIRRITRRFADSGYAAVAPDLFAGLGPKPICMMRTVAAYRKGGGRALKAIEASRAWLADRPEVDASRIGVAGFCMGGGFALLMGTTSTVGVAATFYGDLPDRAEDLEGVCPVIASYGGRDRLFAKKGRRLKRYLDDLGVSNDVKVYDDAGHSFMSQHSGLTARIGALSPLRVRYNEPAAEDAWSRMLSFFAEHLPEAADK
ncbi:MAG: dienelactone hydrolase family protein [Dehalococcoidia bacterium]